jgi:hypothetical protein
MGILDDLVVQYGGATAPQALQLPPNFQPEFYRPTPDATFPNLPANAQTPSSAGLPIAKADPWIWLSPDGNVSYTGRQDAPPAAALTNNNPLSANALTLMALGGGIAQGGIGKGLEQAAAAVQADRNRQGQQANLLQTYNALTSSGVPPQEARIAVSNPGAMRAVVTKYFGPRASPTRAGAPQAGPSVSQGAFAAPTTGDAAQPSVSDAASVQRVAQLGPARPPGLPDGCQYSPSRCMWRAPDGALFHSQGQALPA